MDIAKLADTPTGSETKLAAQLPGQSLVDGKRTEGKGRLALHGAYFDIATGTLSVLNHSRGEFFAL